VNLSTGAYDFLFDDFVTYAFRGIAVNAAASKLYLVDQDWSNDSTDYGVLRQRIFSVDLADDGAVSALGDGVVTDGVGDAGCGSPLQWPSATAMLTIGTNERLVIGHNEGLTVYNPNTLNAVQELDMSTFGTLFGQIATSPDGARLYAMPQCKASNDDHDWTLP
jgi:hypothetical protein